MVLSDVDILKCMNEKVTLIKPFYEDRLQGASYDLSISNKIAIFKKQVRTIDLEEQSVIDDSYEERELSDGGYTLDPGEYILATVAEKISVPTNMVAHIRPRTRFTRLGVVVSAQHCNPGYAGVLQLGVYNASPNAIVLRPNLRIAQIVFEELKSEPSHDRQYQNKKDSAYMGEREFRGAVFGQKELSPNAQRLYDAVLKDVGEV